MALKFESESMIYLKSVKPAPAKQKLETKAVHDVRDDTGMHAGILNQCADKPDSNQKFVFMNY